ncbi:conserved hypothetical protein [Vibrio crassostreae]|nr:hypothetical protein BCT81_07450 [Vibrio sp. 10N.261.52.A1]TCU01406.1 hypothetical protein EDB47_11877 [Vibrio crassostreae]CAK2342489.1 conserved hypothetical protein [Vibrio crassostreae]CAK2812425.1 conserved hypothetical protein [Vibrio crassostreae]CAK2896537.1 conserved hypothetical protein [Vibrio crassostreae]
MASDISSTICETKDKMSTQEVASFMLESGEHYTAARLSKELGIPLANASGNLYNIKTCKKYETSLVGTPVSVKVVDIRGLKKGQRLWSQILTSCWS